MPAITFVNGTKVPTVTLFVLVDGVKMAVPLPAFIDPPPPTVKVSAFKVMVLLLVDIVFVPIDRVPPAPVLRVTPAGPLTFPFSVMPLLLANVTEPELALELKFTAPVLLRFILPAPPVTMAVSVPVLVAKAMPEPIEPPAELRLTVPVAPTLIFPEALLLMLPPTSTVTLLLVAVMTPLLVKVPPPVLWKLRLAVVVRAAPTVMFPV